MLKFEHDRAIELDDTNFFSFSIRKIWLHKPSKFKLKITFVSTATKLKRRIWGKKSSNGVQRSYEEPKKKHQFNVCIENIFGSYCPHYTRVLHRWSQQQQAIEREKRRERAFQDMRIAPFDATADAATALPAKITKHTKSKQENIVSHCSTSHLPPFFTTSPTHTSTLSIFVNAICGV